MQRINIQLLVDKKLAPKPALLRKWARAALANQRDNTEVTLRIVECDEMTQLNTHYRKKAGPTNVLSFPADLPPDLQLDHPILGDIVICADIVAREASEQNKDLEAHWAHMVVHGVYHLLGYDHEDDQEAKVMEDLEIDTLKKLGFQNPYGDAI